MNMIKVEMSQGHWRRSRNMAIENDALLMSLCYDLGLLPEQVVEDRDAEWRLNILVLHWLEREKRKGV